MAEKKSPNVLKYLAAFAIVAAFGLLVLTSQPAAQAGSAKLDANVNSVLLYSNGMAYVTARGTADVASAGRAYLRMANFSQSALIDTLRADDADGDVFWAKRYYEKNTKTERKERYYTFDELMNLSYGKQVTVKSADGQVSGTLQWVSGGKIGVSSNGNLLVVSEPQSVQVAETAGKTTDEINTTATEQGLEIYLDSRRAGRHDLLLSYMESGAGWRPTYNFQLGSARSGSSRLEAFGLVQNSGGQDWNNTALRLAVGQPNFVSGIISPYYNRDFSNLVQKAGGMAEAAAAPAPSFSGSDVGTLYVYTLSEPVTLRSGEQANFRIFSSDVGYEKENVWEGWGAVQQTLKVKNTAGKPLAAGTMRVYDAGTFMGEGSLEYAGIGKEATVSYAALPAVEVKKESNQTSDRLDSPDRTVTTYRVAMAVSNGQQSAVELTLRDTMTYGDQVELVESSAPVSQLSGNRLEWKVSVPAGGKLSVSYAYKVTYFQQPVRYY